jgi:hypothetical protein
VRNLTLLFTEATSLEASGSGTPPQRAGDLVVLAHLWAETGIPQQGADSISQPRRAEKVAGGRDSPLVRNLHL